MFLTAFLCGFLFLHIYADASFNCAILPALIGAISGTVTELVSPSEYDTVTVPMVILATLLLIY